MFNTETIESEWRPRRGDREASAAMWDSMADDFGDHELPTFEDDQLLGIFERYGMLGPKVDVLDVACGAGAHSLAIADRVRSVVGVDISPAMIAHAEEQARAMRLDNSRFVVEDWSELDVDAEGMVGAFDLVFAHMTPAIDSAATFDKLSRASRSWCALAKPVHRHDPISDGLRKVLGITEGLEDGARDILYGFNLLWQRQLCPRIEYRETVWNHKRSLEKACSFYINRMRTYRAIGADDLVSAEEYLRSVADAEGLVGEKTDVTVATLFWRAPECA